MAGRLVDGLCEGGCCSFNCNLADWIGTNKCFLLFIGCDFRKNCFQFQGSSMFSCLPMFYSYDMLCHILCVCGFILFPFFVCVCMHVCVCVCMCACVCVCVCVCVVFWIKIPITCCWGCSKCTHLIHVYCFADVL